MSGAIPPYFPPLKPLLPGNLFERPQIGIRPDYKDVKIIDTNQYSTLIKQPDAALTTRNFWELRKYEFDQFFKCLDSEKSVH